MVSDNVASAAPASSGPKPRTGFWSALGRLILLQGEPVAALTDPAEIFWDDLTAANRLKIYLLSSGADIPGEIEESLAELTVQYDPAKPDTPAYAPAAPSPGYDLT